MDDGIKSIVFAAANEIKAIVSQRVHNKGLATDGTKFTPYVSSTKRARKKLGRQIEFKDYEVTGRYKNAYTVGSNQAGNIVLGFDEPYQLGNYSLVSIIENKNKDHGGAKRLSQAEIEHAQNTIGKLLEQWRNNLFKS